MAAGLQHPMNESQLKTKPIRTQPESGYKGKVRIGYAYAREVNMTYVTHDKNVEAIIGRKIIFTNGKRHNLRSYVTALYFECKLLPNLKSK